MKQNQYTILSVIATTLIALGILGFLALGVHPAPVAIGLIGILIHAFKSRLTFSPDQRMEAHVNLRPYYIHAVSLMPLLVVTGLTAWLVRLGTFERVQYALTQESEGYGSAVFTFLIAPISTLTLIGLALIPSVKMFRRRRRIIDLVGVILSSTLLVLIVTAWIAFEPIRKNLIFHH